MFEILMELPLFRGATRERMAETVGMAKFHFLKYLPGETIVEAGAPCTHIKFIISGSVRSKIVNPDSRFKVSQTLVAPDVISPDYLFGRATNYPCTVTAIEPTGILQIAKNDYIKILNSDEVFMFNYLNMLSMNAQKSVSGVLALTTGSIEERIAFWIVALTQPSGKDIALECRQRDMYSFFGVQRSSFIATLDSMKERGLVTYDSTKIDIPDRRKLIELLETKLHDNITHDND
ncbi:MAG: Crp/Fnr family transcriptional regulator [Muribaculaceae bacterium]|nr:Crp/Fnr family transcriptional regulator [Muribaculaceae bacterium]MDE5595491.1 Crp/Fnr family transcriptional regulator [Muribaculaceae bacterium]